MIENRVVVSMHKRLLMLDIVLMHNSGLLVWCIGRIVSVSDQVVMRIGLSCIGLLVGDSLVHWLLVDWIVIEWLSMLQWLVVDWLVGGLMLEVVLLDELLVLDDWLVAVVVAHYILVHDVLMDQAFMGKWLCLMCQSLMDEVSPCWRLDCVVLMDHLLLEWGGLHVDSSHLSLVEVHHLMWADHMLDCLMFLVGRVPLEVVMRPVLIVGDLLVMLPAVDMVVHWLDGDRSANMVVAMLDISLLLMDGMLIPMIVSSILEWMLLISMVVGEAMVVRIVEHLGMIQGVHR